MLRIHNKTGWILILVLIVACQEGKCQKLDTARYKIWNASDTLQWRDYRHAEVNHTLAYGFQAKAVTSYAYFYLPEIWHADSCMNVLTTFRKRNSYTADTTSTDLLAHESIHFDIAEVFARHLRKVLLDLSQKQEYTLDQYLISRDSLFEAGNTYQALYDDETVYGLNKKQQQKWKDHIKSELEIWQEYSFENMYQLYKSSLTDHQDP